MPWKETSAMDQRIQLIGDWLSGEYTKRDLSHIYEISRPTVDKWITRYLARGAPGLEADSRAPRHHPNQTAAPLCEAIVATKLRHQRWGPKKVLDWLRRHQPHLPWPADSTAGLILKRAGLVRPRVRRRHMAPHTDPFRDCAGPNQVWSADFKGDFRLGNGARCYPLTLSDNFSRYLLLCQALTLHTYDVVRPWMEWSFREYGLPEAIRTDNGPPFASLVLSGISPLAKWWIQLGIRPERIRPAKPAQNGRHERMHRTLKDAVPPQADLQAQQRHYEPFREEYNWERSHEALNRQLPGSVYQASPRPYPRKLRPIEYEAGFMVRRVRHNGEIKWKGHHIYVSEVLAKEPLGLKPLDDERWELYYSFQRLGIWNPRTNTITQPVGWHGDNSNNR
jgi:putative transposase